MSHLKESLLKKIDDRTAVVGVVGLGYVGLPLVVAFAEAGFKVVGVDVDQAKVDGLNAGESHVEDVPSPVVAKLVNEGVFMASSSYQALETADTISICVPTPLSKSKDPDVSYIISATEEIVAVGAVGKLIVLESTTYPGTTEEVILPRLSEGDKVAGENFFLAFSPERIDPGRTDHNMWTTPKVMGGMTEACLDVSTALYGTVVQNPVPVSSPAAAEMVKLLENTFRAVNIGLVNEIALMCNKLGLNVWEVIDAAATKPYGFMKFTPGPGLGGHCIPIDPHYLSWKLRTLNYNARFIQLADEVNGSMPDYVVSKISDALNEQGKAIRNSQILVLGVAYKPNIADVRESPALDIISLLEEKGAGLIYHDPYIPSIEYDFISMVSVDDPYEAAEAADCVVIVTNHKVYDWDRFKEISSIIVDTRNAMPNLTTSNYTSL